MALPLIIFLLLGGFLSYLSPNRKYLLRVYLINVIIMVSYNLILWTYIFKNLDAGGASLGPGLLLLGVTAVHLLALGVYIIWKYKAKYNLPLHTDKMDKDQILEIGINSLQQLYIKPTHARFTLVWRSATEVHWNDEEDYLYSPVPREWSYLDWYKHIVRVVQNEYECTLIVTPTTQWINIPDDLKQMIVRFNL